MKKGKNLYLEALEFGEDNLDKRIPLTFNKIKEHLETLGYAFTTNQELNLLSDFTREAFNIYIGNDNFWKDEPHYLNIEGYFKLLEYRELSEARKSSREARFYAIIAIVISIIVGLVQLFGTTNTRITNLPNTHDVNVTSNIIKTEVSNFPQTQGVLIKNSSLKTEIINPPLPAQ